MINKSDSRCAVVRFCYHSYDYRPNWTPLSPITITYTQFLHQLIKLLDYLPNYNKINNNKSNKYKNCFSWKPCLKIYLKLRYYLKLWRLDLDLNLVSEDACLRSIGKFISVSYIKDDLQSVMCPLESLFAVFVLYHARYHARYMK